MVVCGFPRSGTTLFYNMLRATLHGFRFDDVELWSWTTIGIPGNHASKAPLDVFKLDEIDQHNWRGKRILPIVIFRDIRDMITSRHPNVPDDYFIGYEASYSVRGTYPNYRLAFDSPGVGAIFDQIEKLRGSERELLMVKYEDIVTEPDVVQLKLARLIDGEFNGLFSEFHRYEQEGGIQFAGRWSPTDHSLAKPNEAISTSFIGRWQDDLHRERVIGQFTRYPHLFDILKHYGYEETNDWFEAFVGTQTHDLDSNSRTQ